MATKGGITPSSDQPRVTQKSLQERSGSPTLQTRNTGFTGYGTRTPMTRSTRSYGR